ncbi:MAG: transcription-repair coupling factor, partial [Chitinophagaceae bacterium]|nr:transcription-repair coupling factor [Chitinophagaceae bacterium]
LLKLSEYQFERCDFVYEPGQFAMRGGILDIYSIGNDKPYRIELFGNEIESIRLIDPETQLSERKLSAVSIIPRMDETMVSGPGVSLLDFLPANTVVWVQDFTLCADRMEDTWESFTTFLKVRTGQTTATDSLEDEKWAKKEVTTSDLEEPTRLQQSMLKRNLVSFGVGAQLPGESLLLELTFSTKDQPSFNRNFDLLIGDLRNWASKNYRLSIFSDNPRQLERLQTIFDDLKAELVFEPVSKSIHEGFIDHDLKWVCYTDHQIFQRYHKYKVKQAYNKNKALTLRTLRELQPGDFVTHIDHGVGVFSGLQKIDVNGRMQEAVRLVYKDSDILYVNINSLHKIAKYSGKEGSVPKVNKLGSDVWNRLKEKT